MGSGIAAHLANAGIPVLLLDLVPPALAGIPPGALSGRDQVAAAGLQAALKSKPAAFFHPRNAQAVTTGNFDDDLGKVAGVDLVIEAVVERLDVKQALFARLEAVIGPEALVASNTSGLRIADMLAGRSPSFRQRFAVMHFFNPARYMKLLELVAGPDTSLDTRARIEHLGREVLGKGVVWAKDTPNFIANRIGAHSLMTVIHTMLARGMSPEDVDAITGVPMGHPRSATFRTADMVGLDTLAHVVANCHRALVDDEDREVFAAPAYLRTMLDRKQLGDKSKGGFYKKVGDAISTLDPATGEYRAKAGDEAVAKATKALARIDDPRERLQKLVATPGVVGEFAWHTLARSLAYAARRIGEICDGLAAIDDGMRWGYNWELGPFEIWDALGFAATVERIRQDGLALPAWIDAMVASGATSFYREHQVWDPARGGYAERASDPRNATLQILRRGTGPVLKNNGAEAWDLGDGILGLTLKSKANSIDPDVIRMLGDAVARAEAEFRAMIIYNTGEFFCVGANLFAVILAAQQKQWDTLRAMAKGYQDATQRLKYASVPVVAAPYNMTLGGGLELCLGCTEVQAAAETYAGLVEAGVGLVPAGAGALNLLWRALASAPEGADVDPYALVTQVFKNIALAKVATSAEEARALGYFRPSDGVSFDRSRQLHETKQRALGLANSGYHAPAPRAFRLPGDSGIATLKMMVNSLVAGGYASEHDGKIAGKLATILCGGAAGGTHLVSEDEILELEREAFVSLCGEPRSLERMQYMLMNNKPLRN
jgi:3-hydroxyacyl-CoA dehydrogenase